MENQTLQYPRPLTTVLAAATFDNDNADLVTARKLHEADGGTIVFEGDKERWFNADGELHCDYGPAEVVHADSGMVRSTMWYRNGNLVSGWDHPYLISYNEYGDVSLKSLSDGDE